MSLPCPTCPHPWKDPIPLVQEVWWFPGPLWMGAENLAATRFSSSDCPACSKLLYRLCYPCPQRYVCTNFMWSIVYKLAVANMVCTRLQRRAEMEWLWWVMTGKYSIVQFVVKVFVVTVLCWPVFANQKYGYTFVHFSSVCILKNENIGKTVISYLLTTQPTLFSSIDWRVLTKWFLVSSILQGVPGGMWNTSGECSLC